MRAPAAAGKSGEQAKTADGEKARTTQEQAQGTTPGKEQRIDIKKPDSLKKDDPQYSRLKRIKTKIDHARDYLTNEEDMPTKKLAAHMTDKSAVNERLQLDIENATRNLEKCNQGHCSTQIKGEEKTNDTTCAI